MRLILFSLLIFIFSNLCYAAPITKAEQQINLINQAFSTSSTTMAPTNNSLGLIEFDSTKYTTPTIDFEAIIRCDGCSGGNAAAVAQLYDAAGNAVDSALVSSTESDYERVRAIDIGDDLSDTTNYTVRLKVDATDTGTAYIKAARLIISQSDTAIDDSRTYIDIGDSTTTTQTTYTEITHEKFYLYTAANHPDSTNIYFEGTLFSSDAEGVASAVLVMGSDCNSSITGSEISVTGTTPALDRTSSSIKTNLSDGVEYSVCLKSSEADTATLSNAHFVIDQSDVDGLQKITTYLQMVNTSATTTSSSFVDTVFPNQFNPNQFVADRIKQYYEVTAKRTAGTAVVDLYDQTELAVISGSELTTTESNYDRLRSSDLFFSLPETASVIDSRFKNNSSESTFISNSWLIVELSQLIMPELTFTLSGVAANTVHNGITTSVASSYNELDFGSISPGTPTYLAHQLYVSTNTESGYQLSLKMLSYLQGNYPANNIDPFISSWNSPTTWTSPTGTTPNDNTGWIGANTSDTRVTGWAGASQKFGPVNNSANIVMTSPGTDSGTTVYVTFAIEANILQASDVYSGSLIYNLIPTY